MLKSLFSGVAGLQSHQVAMDIESNNIANVNTVGFKYSRANFSDLLAQTKSIATAPQGALGGKNAVQVGLGSTVASATRIFSQGSIQNSGKNTDVAIQGDGFFMISPDGGNTYKYTRDGNFSFDAGGNFVDSNGFIAQGWLRDKVTGKVDSTAPITNINIAPGLTTPAQPTQAVVLKANLNSGPLVKSFSPAYEVKTGTPPSVTTPGTGNAIDANGNPIASGNVGVMFNEVGEAFSLQKGQGVWASFQSSTVNGTADIKANGGALNELNITFTLDDGTTKNITTSGATGSETAIENANRYVSAINAQSAITGVSATVNLSSGNPKIDLVNTNGTASASHNIKLTGAATKEAFVTTFAANTDADTIAFDGVSVTLNASQTDIQNATKFAKDYNTNGTGNFTAVDNLDGTVTFTKKVTGPITDIVTNDFTITSGGTSADTTVNVATPIFQGSSAANNGWDTTTASTVNITAYRYQYDPSAASTTANLDKKFKTISDLRYALETQAKAVDGNGNGAIDSSNIEISVNSSGKILVTNPGGAIDDYDMNLKITGLTGSGITENTRFTRNMEALNSVLPAGSGGKAFSQSFNAATHSSSIDIFDSLGSKHTLRMDLRKTALDVATGSTWDMVVSVPSPATIDTTAPFNEKTGSIRFNNDGSLATYNPPNISFSGNNGSAPDQQVALSFGTANAFDGMTSFDSNSSTSGISQDGFTGGDLVGIRIDQSGTLVGSFSNGRSFGLAQIGMAKFTNNEGLSTEGGNVYVQTANSGDPIIGTAATAGRGFIQSSALEASNVDLSRALTQLIIIQRGFQANGKTITTSDQLLQTLIGLKN